MDTITVNGIEYVKKDRVQKEEINGEYKIVRTYSAGVFFAIVESEEGQTAVLRNARRIWYWSGAASISQLAIDGVSNPNDCKFPEAVSKIKVYQVIEILDVTEKAKKSIDEVPIWKS